MTIKVPDTFMKQNIPNIARHTDLEPKHAQCELNEQRGFNAGASLVAVPCITSCVKG